MDIIKGRTALVTGANRGIGKTIVEKFLQEGAKKIYIASRDLKTLKPLQTQYGDQVVPLHIDLNKPETIPAAAAIATDVDVVVNNAGMLNVERPLSVNAIDAFKQEMEVNVYGLMRVAQAFAPVLKANGGGTLIQLNSVASIKSFADFSTYSASKAASYSITQALRDTLQEQGTQVISVHPGPIATDMATTAGFTGIAEPAELVAQGILSAMTNNDFHIFPDTVAKQMGGVYENFASNIVEANFMEA